MAVIDVSLQLETVTGAPSIVATLMLCVGPNPVPLSVIVVPTDPLDGESPVTVSASSTVKLNPALVTPFSTTVTGPVVAFGLIGTCAVMLVLVHDVTFATNPLK